VEQAGTCEVSTPGGESTCSASDAPFRGSDTRTFNGIDPRTSTSCLFRPALYARVSVSYTRAARDSKLRRARVLGTERPDLGPHGDPLDGGDELRAKVLA
jgi:hypothetical protein